MGDGGLEARTSPRRSSSFSITKDATCGRSAGVELLERQPCYGVLWRARPNCMSCWRTLGSPRLPPPAGDAGPLNPPGARQTLGPGGARRSFGGGPQPQAATRRQGIPRRKRCGGWTQAEEECLSDGRPPGWRGGRGRRRGPRKKRDEGLRQVPSPRPSVDGNPAGARPGSPRVPICRGTPCQKVQAGRVRAGSARSQGTGARGRLTSPSGAAVPGNRWNPATTSC